MTILVTVTVRDISYAEGKLLGGFFIALGLMNSLSSKATSEKLFSKTQSSLPFVAKVCAHIGEKGLQTLYLGIGVILVLAGFTVIPVSRASKILTILPEASRPHHVHPAHFGTFHRLFM